MSNEINEQAEMAKYINPVRVASVDAVALYLLLEQRKHSDIKSEERAALDEVKRSSENVRAVRIARERSSPAALKEPRHRTGSAVVSLHGALGAVAALSAEVGPEGAQAAELIARVFPGGTRYVQGDAMEVWEGASAALQVIDTENLGPRIDALVHPALLRAMRAAHEQLGRAIGVTGGVTPSVPANALRDAMSRFTFAVAQYARILAARVRHDDEASLAAFMSALSPLDGVRVGGEREDEEATEPTEPSPQPFDGTNPLVPNA